MRYIRLEADYHQSRQKKRQPRSAAQEYSGNFSASSFSLRECTYPFRVTLLLFTTAEICPASTPALRRKAARIFCSMSVAVMAGFMVIRLITERTPVRFSIADRAKAGVFHRELVAMDLLPGAYPALHLVRKAVRELYQAALRARLV